MPAWRSSWRGSFPSASSARLVSVALGLSMSAGVACCAGSRGSVSAAGTGSASASRGSTHKTSRRPLVVGLAGCTASGKSTLCDAIVARQGSSAAVGVVTLDEFWLPLDRVPKLPMAWLRANTTMAKLKAHDTNIPAAMDWEAAEARVVAAIQAATEAATDVLFVEGFLLFSQPQLLARLDRLVYLTVDDAEGEVLMMRKWGRAHLGKPSYEDRGVTVEEYRRYWEECVIGRFQKWGASRPAGTVEVPCMMPTAEQVEILARELPLPDPRR